MSWVCISQFKTKWTVQSETDPTKGYTVYTGDKRFGPSCDCKAFEYAKTDADGFKRCKHIRKVEEILCDYTEAIDGPPKGGKCPKCGGSVVVAELIR